MKQENIINKNASSTIDMIEQDLHQYSRLSWWYRLSSPPRPASTASFTQREAYRRGKLISIVLLMQLFVAIALIPTLGFFVNHALIPNLVTVAVVLIIATFLNRHSQVVIAGILAVAALDLSLMLNLASYPQISSFLLPMLDLLVLPELFAVSLLPPALVFVEAFIHICFIVASLTFLFPQSRELHALLQTASFQDALARPIVIQILVAFITFLWVNSSVQAIKRADRATSIAMLEREMAEQGVLATEEKQRLEKSIREIVAVHMRVANGDYTARVSLAQNNALWEIAASLNNVLNRLQRSRQDSLLLQRMSEAVERFLRVRSQSQNSFMPWLATNTPIDTLVQQHNTFVHTPPSTQTQRDNQLSPNQK